MATYLVTLSLGPVQSLIEAARRTRDLWCGSWLLAEVAKAAARVLYSAHPNSLIFPCPDNPQDELAPSTTPQDNDANIANIIRAQIDLPNESAVRALLEQAKHAAAQRLSALCDKARSKLPGLPFHDNLWKEQKDDILETFAAWVEVKNDDYEAASTRLGGILAARKATRMFSSAAISGGIGQPGYGVPKSSLDGAREAVINVARKDRELGPYRTALRKLGMSVGEELDALAVAKRMAGTIDQFTAYSRIAADAWIEDLKSRSPTTALDEINRAYEPLVKAELATRVAGNAGIYGAMPYDAQLVFGFRLDNALANADAPEKDLLTKLRVTLRDLDQPMPYAVILKADGDRMGELLSKANSADQSRAISKALHGFAQSVRAIVREHRGHAIYAGGDDVLALVPLQQSVACAAALAKAFKKAMREPANRLQIAANRQPTLSVGLGIGHLVEPLGRLRARADSAERHAKGDGTTSPRNALAIKLGIRSGTELLWRCRWNDSDGEPQDCAGIKAILEFIQFYRDPENKCPSRLGYDLRAIALRLSWVHVDEENILPDIHAAELARTLDRAHQRGGDGELSDGQISSLTTRAQAVGLSQLADELIIARWLSARTKSDIGILE